MQQNLLHITNKITEYIFLCGYFGLLPLYCILIDNTTKFTVDTVVACILLSVISVFLLWAVVRRKQACMSLNIIDAIFAALIVYWMFNLLAITRFTSVDIFSIFLLLDLCMLYVIIKLVRFQTVVNVILLSGVLQIIVVVLQYFGYFIDNNVDVIIKGTFQTQALLGGFICMITILTLSELIRLVIKKHKVWILYLLYLILLIAVLFLSNSRAAWFATLCGSAVLLYYYVFSQLHFYKIICIMAIAASSLVALYYIRPESANGRILIWRCSLDMFKDAPVVGHGINGFQHKYMYYQAEFLAQHPDSQLSHLSDNVIYVFNEPLKILVEQGCLGILLYALMLLAILWSCRRYNSGRNRTLCAALVSCIMFSLFSYPSASILIMSLLVATLAMFKTATITAFKIRSYYILFIIFALGCILFVSVIQYRVCLKWDRINKTSISDRCESVFHDTEVVECFMNHAILANNYTTSRMLLAVIPGDDPNLVNIYLQCFDVFPSSNLAVQIGDIYKSIKQLNPAEYYYSLAHNMNQNRITPLFKLFELYVEFDRHEDATKIARLILTQNYKVESTDVLIMRAVVKNYIQNTLP